MDINILVITSIQDIMFILLKITSFQKYLYEKGKIIMLEIRKLIQSIINRYYYYLKKSHLILYEHRR